MDDYYDSLKLKFQIENNFAIKDPFAQIKLHNLSLDILRPRWSRVADDRLRLFHMRPSWGMFGLLLKAAFLSGIEDMASCLT